MSARTFLDTNVLVYLFDADEPTKRERAKEILSVDASREFVLSTQVLGELYVCLTRKLARPLTTEAAQAVVNNLCELQVVPTDSTLVRRAVSTSRNSQVSYWDALIIEAASSSGCFRILTEDLADGSEYGGVRIEDPFRAA